MLGKFTEVKLEITIKTTLPIEVVLARIPKALYYYAIVDEQPEILVVEKSDKNVR